MKRAEALLHSFLPNVDLNDPSLDAALQQGLLQPAAPVQTQSAASNNPRESTNGAVLPPGGEKAPLNGDGCAEAHLESMVRATGQLDLDEFGNLDYHGHSSGLSFIRRLKEQYGDLIGPQAGYYATPFVKSRPLSLVFDSPKSNVESPIEAASPGSDLPSKDIARQLCDNAIDEASSLMRVLHKPTFDKRFDRMFDTPMENYDNQQQQFLPLLHAVMALGSLFSKDYKQIDEQGYESCIDEG